MFSAFRRTRNGLFFSSQIFDVSRRFCFHLRSYQHDCINECMNRLENGQNRQLVLLPVASGKTVIMAHLIDQVISSMNQKKKILVLAHRREILHQTKSTIERVNSNIKVEFDIADSLANIDDSDVILGSVQTLYQGKQGNKLKFSRLKRYNPEDFGALLIDEAHHAPAKSYVEVIDYFMNKDIMKQFLLWGCTATPLRTDQISLLNIFGDVVFEKNLIELMKEKYLSPIIPISVSNSSTVIPLTEEDIARSEFEMEKLSKIVNTINRNKLIIQSFDEHISTSRKATLVFACDLEHCNQLLSSFQEYFKSKNQCESLVTVVKGSTPLQERQHILEEFRAGNIKVLINCGVFTEGVDIPNIDSIIIARPTLSNILYYQMIGRGLRPFLGKVNCLVIDIIDQLESKFYSVVTSSSLFGLQTKNSKNRTILELKEDALEEHLDKEAIEYNYLCDISDSKEFLYNENPNYYTSLEWLKDVNSQKFVLPIKEIKHFGVILIERKRLNKRQKSPEYSWKTGYSNHHLLPDKFIEPSKNEIRYSYSAKFMQNYSSIPLGECETTTIGISENLNQVIMFSENFVKEKYPESYKETNRDNPWKTEIWTAENKLEGLGIPHEQIICPFFPLTKGTVQFYRYKLKIKDILANGVSQLDNDLQEKYPQLRIPEESKLDWVVLNRSTKCLLLPCSFNIPINIEIMEYLPSQYKVTESGMYEKIISLEESSSHLTEHLVPDGKENLTCAFKLAEEYISKRYPKLISLKKYSENNENSWKSHPATDRQKLKMGELQIPILDGITKGDAALAISSCYLERTRK